jgi:hypothetical protein
MLIEFVWVYNGPIDRILSITMYGKDALAPHESSLITPTHASWNHERPAALSDSRCSLVVEPCSVELAGTLPRSLELLLVIEHNSVFFSQYFSISQISA